MHGRQKAPHMINSPKQSLVRELIIRFCNRIRGLNEIVLTVHQLRRFENVIRGSNLYEATDGPSKQALFLSDLHWSILFSAGFADVQTYTCGSLLRDTSGSFSSPDQDGDGQYESNQRCRWTIVAEEHNMIQLQVHELDIEEQESCYYDYLAVSFNGIKYES